jgi:pilus assembly protein CpaC
MPVMTMRCLLPVIVLALAATAAAQPRITARSDASESIQMEVGETRLIHLSQSIIRISVADPDVADVQVVTPQQVLVTAKAVGYTHLIIWGSDDAPLAIAVSCTRNLGQLRQQFTELFPRETIRVGSVGDLVVLSGNVSDLRLPARAAEVAQLYSDHLANLIEVSGHQQVLVEVRFAEVSRSALRRLGVNFFFKDLARNNVGGLTTPGTQTGTFLDPQTPLPHIPGADPEVMAPTAGDAFNLFFSTGLPQFPFSAILSILSQEGLARVLAEPTLVAFSGSEASFHAGGEVPILISERLGQTTVQFKKFGISLAITPTVLGGDSVNLALNAEVSEIDPAAGVRLGGFQVPGFRTRSSQTTVRLRDGQSFAVAGLLSQESRRVIRRIPVLGDLPILGALFRSTEYERAETELLVVVTARLVQPLDPGEAPRLPGENELNEPSDLDLFLLGRISGSEDPDPEGRRRDRTRGGPAGPIGFIRD